MEALIFFIFPLFIYLALKVAIWRDRDTTEIDLKRYAEGVKMIQFGFVEEALLYFDKVVVQNPKSMVAYAKRGYCHLLLKNYYQAIYNYTKAQSLNHDLPEVFLYKGICLYKIDDFDLALKEFTKAIWFYRDKNAEAFHWRGLVNEKLGKKEAAKSDFERAKSLRNMEQALNSLKSDL